MVASVTTIGCMPRNATKNPLNAPEAMPTPTPAATRTRGDSGFLQRLASTTLTSEITAPAERSKPPDSTTIVCPMAASASVAPLVAI